MNRKTCSLMLGALLLAIFAQNIGTTLCSFVDGESISSNSVGAWTSILWKKTSQSDFNAGLISNVDTSTSPGDVTLATSSNISTGSPTVNTGASWTNPSQAYPDAGSAAAITSGSPSGNNVWGNYGFNLNAKTITQVRVRYDAWTTPNVTFRRQA